LSVVLLTGNSAYISFLVSIFLYINTKIQHYFLYMQSFQLKVSTIIHTYLKVSKCETCPAQKFSKDNV